MRSLLVVLLSFFLATQMVWIPLARAGDVTYHSLGKTSGGSLSGDARVVKVGNLQGSGVASIHDNKIDIIFGTVDLTQKIPPALIGDTFKTKTTTVDGKTTLTGFAFFHHGTSIDKLSAPHSVDTVSTTDGTTFKGHINTVTDDSLSISTDTGDRTVALDTISHLKSSRVYEFTLPVTSTQSLDGGSDFRAETAKINFSSTMKETVAVSVTSSGSQKGSKTGRHCNKLKLALIIVITGALIATAIAVPIAVAVGTHHHSDNSQNQLAETLFLINAAKAKAAAAAAATAATAAPKVVKAVAPVAHFDDF